MAKQNRTGRPVQVYLADGRRELVDEAAARLRWSKSECLRVAVDRFLADLDLLPDAPALPLLPAVTRPKKGGRK